MKSAAIDEALMTRITRFFADAIEKLPPADKAKALSASDDILSVIETVAHPRTRTSPEYQTKLAGALQKRKMLDADGGVIGPSEAASLLGITRQAVSQRRAANKLLGVPVAGGFVYPVWQFSSGEVLEDLERVLRELSYCDGWMKMAFFLSPNRALGGRRPLDELRGGRADDVERAARSYLEQGPV